jgi:hypothetical protein
MDRGGPLPRKRSTPRAWNDQNLYRQFGRQNPDDELERFLLGDVWDRVCETWDLFNELHTHHIFHAGKRVDLWSNFIRVSGRAHYYCHKDAMGGKVAALWAVIQRTERDVEHRWQPGRDLELMLAEARSILRDEWTEASGKADAVDWVEGQLDAGAVPIPYRPMARKVIAWMNKNVEVRA